MSITIPAVNALGQPNAFGDPISIEVQLKSSDFNETNENEPWLIQSSGGEQVTFEGNPFGILSWADYSQPLVINYYALKPGETITVSSTEDDGDEDFPEVNVWVHNPDATLKKFSADLGGTFSWLGDVLSVAGYKRNPLGETLDTVGSVSSIVGTLFSELAKDPVDPNYTQIATPVILSIGPVATAGSGMSATTAAAFNALEDNQEHMVAVALALYTTLNRISGAQAANNTYWIDQQSVAKTNLTSQLAALCASEATDVTNLQNALTADGVNLTITSTDVTNFQIQVYDTQYGSPFPVWTAMVTDLKALGADAGMVNEVIFRLTNVDPNKAAGTFPALLTNPALMTALQNFSKAFGIPFASFDAQLQLGPSFFSLAPKTVFTLDPKAPAIDLSKQALSLQVGPDNLNIPAGSFVQLGNSGNWTFSGPVGTASVSARLDALPTGVYQLRLEASNVNTSALSNPVTVKLTLGSSFGSASVNPTLLNPKAAR